MSDYVARVNPFTGNLQLVQSASILNFKEGVSTYNHLPVSGNAKNDARFTNDTGKLYIWFLDATSGNLTDWIDQGDIISIDWSAITGKPSSAVADIDDSVTKRHTQNSDTILDEGGLNEKKASEIIKSQATGSYKKVTMIQYNPVTEEIKVEYEN